MEPNSQIINGLTTLAVAGVIAFRTLRTQTVRVWALVAMPIIIFVGAIGYVASKPPTTALGDAIVVGGLLAGLALGYARGIHSRLKLGPRPGTVVVQGNLLLVAILIGAFALRFAVRSFVGAGSLSLAVSDAFIILVAVSIGVARLMLFVKWRRLVAAGPAEAR